MIPADSTLVHQQSSREGELHSSILPPTSINMTDPLVPTFWDNAEASHRNTSAPAADILQSTTDSAGATAHTAATAPGSMSLVPDPNTTLAAAQAAVPQGEYDAPATAQEPRITPVMQPAPPGGAVAGGIPAQAVSKQMPAPEQLAADDVGAPSYNQADTVAPQDSSKARIHIHIPRDDNPHMPVDVDTMPADIQAPVDSVTGRKKIVEARSDHQIASQQRSEVDLAPVRPLAPHIAPTKMTGGTGTATRTPIRYLSTVAWLRCSEMMSI